MKINLLFSLVCASTLAFAGCSGDDSSVSSGTGTESESSSGSSGSDSASASASSTSTSTSSTTASGSASDSNSSSGGGACIPGQSVACTCPNGLMGAQVCAQDGMSFGACECADATTTTDTTNPTTTDPTTTDPTTTGVDPTTTTGMDTTTTTGGTTGGAMEPYGACPGGNDNECLDGETCITGETGGQNGFEWSLCTPGTCQGINQCDTIPGDICADTPGDGMFQPYCVPQQCGFNQPPCPDGMQCAAGFQGNPSVCLWPI